VFFVVASSYLTGTSLEFQARDSMRSSDRKFVDSNDGDGGEARRGTVCLGSQLFIYINKLQS
jgi:hypothetical protein